MTLTSRRTLLFALVIVLLFVVAVIGTYNTLTSQYPGHNDFLSRWEGARSFWVDGLNPYGAQASLNIQERIYGRPVVEGEDPGYFAYPFYTVFLLWPIVGTSYAWASAIWMVLLEACLLASLFLLLDHFQWRPTPLLLGGLVLFSLLSYFPARGLLLGQPGHLVYFLQVLAIWGLARRQDTLAGAALAISTIKPQMGYLLVPFLLLWGLRERRWYLIGSFILVFGVAMLASFVVQPGWMSEWLGQVALYPTYTEIGSPAWVLAHLPWLTVDPVTEKWIVAGGYGNVIETVLLALGYGLLLWSWFEVLIRRRRERFMWTIVLTLVLTHLVAPRTASPHFVVFTIPLLFYLRWMVNRWPRGGNLAALLLLAVLFVSQWAHFLLTVEGEFEHPTVYLPTPFVLLVVVLLTRRMWFQDPHDRFQNMETGG